MWASAATVIISLAALASLFLLAGLQDVLKRYVRFLDFGPAEEGTGPAYHEVVDSEHVAA